MPKINDGGPAFPRPIGEARGLHHRNWNMEQDGMSLRDYFAASALSGALASPGSMAINGQRVNEAYEWARWAYAVADAMIAQREMKS